MHGFLLMYENPDGNSAMPQVVCVLAGGQPLEALVPVMLDKCRQHLKENMQAMDEEFIVHPFQAPARGMDIDIEDFRGQFPVAHPKQKWNKNGMPYVRGGYSYSGERYLVLHVPQVFHPLDGT